MADLIATENLHLSEPIIEDDVTFFLNNYPAKCLTKLEILNLYTPGVTYSKFYSTDITNNLNIKFTGIHFGYDYFTYNFKLNNNLNNYTNNQLIPLKEFTFISRVGEYSLLLSINYIPANGGNLNYYIRLLSQVKVDTNNISGRFDIESYSNVTFEKIGEGFNVRRSGNYIVINVLSANTTGLTKDLGYLLVKYLNCYINNNGESVFIGDVYDVYKIALKG